MSFRTIAATNRPNMPQRKCIQALPIFGGAFPRKFNLHDSLAILIWQILAGESLSQDTTSTEIYKQFKGANDPLLHEIIGDCFDVVPSARPKSAILSQRLLDKYNDACAKSAIEELSNDRTAMTEIMTLLQRCQELVLQGRRNLPKNPKDILQPSEVDLLFQYEDSWDQPASLRLAPETCFLVGAGLLWDYIEVSDIERHRKGVEEMKSFEGMPRYRNFD